jgi:hypothetical protein
MRRLEFPTGLVSPVFLLAMLVVPLEVAQAIVIPWIGPDQGDWNAAVNWQDGAIFGLPNVANNESGGIGNNATAILSAPAGTSIGGLFLGQAASTTGGLRINNGGSLTNIAGASELGAITVGATGQGNLDIRGGGSLSGTSLTLAGATGSSLLIGDTSGLTATLTTSGNATLGRTTEITGRFVNFNVGGNLTLNSTNKLVGTINHNSLFSPIKSTGTANISGTFQPKFTGVTPAAGNSWSIIDASAINGSFTSLDTSAAPALSGAQIYRLKRTTGGANGQLLQLVVSHVLTLQVHRGTGEMTLFNSGTNPVTIDGYSVLSSFGALTGTWNSLTDQSVPGWIEAEPMTTDLSELHPQAGGFTLGAGQSKTLGSPYVAKFPQFGVDPDHLEFEYSTTDHEEFTGFVDYLGPKINNDLIINVNPLTGQAQLKNDSPFTIKIDGYSLYSPSGSLQPANGKWMSLQDRGVGDWEEALPATNVLSELSADGSLTLSPFSGYDLGELYKSVGGTQDLRLEFLLDGVALPVDGEVVYGAFSPVSPPGLAGDFNNDGSVNAADYTVWRDNFGSANETALNGNGDGINGVDQGDYALWKSRFGTGGGSGSALSNTANVPEPATGFLMLIAALMFCCRRESMLRITNCLNQIGTTGRAVFPARCALVRSMAAICLACCLSQLGFAQTVIFKDDFDGDAVPSPGATPVAGENVGLPWGNNSISPSIYQSAASPFASGTFYANLTDPGTGTAPSQAVRLQSTAGNVTTFESSLNGQLSTFSFDFYEPTRAGDVNTMMAGYYRQQANPDLNGAGRSYTSTLHDGTLGPQGTVLGGAATPYPLDTVHTLFIIANDTASAVANYLGTGRTIADTSADVWISLGGASPTYAFSVDKQNAATLTPLSGVGFRTFNPDVEQFFINNVLVVSGPSFDRTAFAGPCDLGDVNCDGTIDIENDFEAILNNFRRNVGARSLGDLTADGLVSLSDFIQWKSAFLNGGGSVDGVNLGFLSVPEPSSAGLALVMLWGAIGCRFRRRRAPLADESPGPERDEPVANSRSSFVVLHSVKCRVVVMLVVAAIVGSWVPSASAVLQVYDGFTYSDNSSILGGNGGGGWNDTWTKTGNTASTEIATTPGSTYSTLPVLGNKATLTGQQAAGTGNSSFTFRTFTSGYGTDGTTAWISLIGQRTGTKTGLDGAGDTASYQRVFGLNFFSGGTATTNERFSVGELSSVATSDDLDRWGLNIFNADPLLAVVSPSTTPVDQLSFLLIRVNFGVGALADNAYMWVNPNLSLGEPSIGSAQATLLNRNLEFDRLRLSAGGSLGTTGEIAAASGILDELRVGTTFASVIGTGLVPGDVNGNGIADINDYLVIRNHFQMTGAARTDGDLNGDAVVNLVDFRMWKASRTAGSGADFNDDFIGSVPEPATFILVVLGAVLAATTRRARVKAA